MGPQLSTLARRYAEAVEHANSERCWRGECPATLAAERAAAIAWLSLVAACDGDLEQASVRAAHYLPPVRQHLACRRHQ